MKLFEEFPPIPKEVWEEAILKDLKGQDYEKRLIWNTKEGFSIRPYYREEDVQKPLPSPPGMPGNWTPVEVINQQSMEDCLYWIEKSLSYEACGIKIISQWTPNGLIGVKLDSKESFQEFSKKIIQLIQKLKLPIHKDYPFQLYWDSSYASLAYLEFWLELEKETYNLPIEVHFLNNPLNYPIIYGKPYATWEKIWEDIKIGVENWNKNISSQHPISVLAVDTRIFRESGANITQELALALSMGTEYLNQLTDKGIKPEDCSSSIVFYFSCGSNYFFEIAKFRTFRFLWNQVLETWGVPQPQRKTHILAETIQWNLTLYDPYVNMLRVTTEAMAAILGGVNSLIIHPYDTPFSLGDDFSRRIARNVHHLLRYESYLDKVVDPASGSYYLEILTREFAQTAWHLFQEWEKNGGYIPCIQKGIIQKQIRDQQTSLVEEILSRKITLLGTNQYPNPKDRAPKLNLPLGNPNAPNPYVKFTQDINTPPVEILQPQRAAIPFEELRKKMEERVLQNNGIFPKVYLFQSGNKAMRTARAVFSTNFFGVLGLDIIDTGGTESPKDKFAELESFQPDILVYCSSDEEYLPFVQNTIREIQKISPKTRFFIAGNPETKEELTKLGIEGFIHIKSHLYNTLKEIFSL